ncbi:hypothetical protein [Phenylobacterium sp.]|jgi:hypothetical protein|uniref:hypothetical protein n=1 Tax=Phenylobacterium sp. TaxID=1871053 RepID=UPI002E3755A9|nr:hypothetical protein [Phenylobacterium sp.]HEX4710679.1 hypothetical protein [Phenylobacterium sp.]
MSSERRVQANRMNASQSTGPRSAAGKARVARNAVKHGLSQPPSRMGEPTGNVRALMLELAGHDAALLRPAHEVAEIYVYLQRLQREKQRVLGQAQAVAVAAAWASLTMAEAEERAAVAAAQRLLTLETYERKARSRLRKAIAGLWPPT